MQGLKKAIDAPNPVVNIASVMALGQMGSSAFEILVESLNTTDNVAVQVAIVNALASVGDRHCVEVLFSPHLPRMKPWILMCGNQRQVLYRGWIW